MPDSNEQVFMVTFANRQAVQVFQEARELAEQLAEDLPWNENTTRLKDCLDAAWEGLSFAMQEV